MAITQVKTKQQILVSADLDFKTLKGINLADPTNAQDAATKAYVDAARTGIDAKASVRAASTANVTVTYNATGGTSLRGQITAAPNAIDGVTLAANNRILLKDQSTGAQNGIWVVSTLGTGANGVWDRATDFDSDAEVTSGPYVWVEEGSTQADTAWVMTNNNPIVIGGAASPTALTWVLFSSAGSLIAGAGLNKTGNQIDIVTASSARIVVNNDSIDLATVTPGTTPGSQIRKIDFDSYGRVSQVTNATLSDINTTVGSQTANTVYAAPNGSAGTPSFRTLVAADIPSLDAAKITTGQLTVAQGGTGAATLTGVVIGTGTTAMTAVASTTALQVLRVNSGGTGYEFATVSFGGGSVTGVSVVTANGFAGTVATPSTTPAITITTSQTGVLIGNGTSMTGLAAGAGDQLLRRNAGNTAYEFFTPSYLTSAVTTISFGTTGLTPNTASSGAVSVAGTLVAANGGTGQSSYAIGDLLYASTTTALSKLAAVAAGSFLRSAGTGTAPAWSTITIPNAAAVGDIWYGSATSTVSSLAGNTTATKQFLSQTGNGSVSAAPVWATLTGSDITGAALTKVDDTNVTLTLGGTPATSLLRAASITVGWSGTLAVGRGGLGISTTPSNGQIPIGNGTNYVAATITGSTTVGVTNGAGTITLAVVTGSTGVVTAPNYVVREIPSIVGGGSFDGSTKNQVSLANSPISGTEHVYVNGVLMNANTNDYAISGATITFQTGAIPNNGDVVLVSYLK